MAQKALRELAGAAGEDDLIGALSLAWPGLPMTWTVKVPWQMGSRGPSR